MTVQKIRLLLTWDNISSQCYGVIELKFETASKEIHPLLFNMTRKCIAEDDLFGNLDPIRHFAQINIKNYRSEQVHKNGDDEN